MSTMNIGYENWLVESKKLNAIVDAVEEELKVLLVEMLVLMG